VFLKLNFAKAFDIVDWGFFTMTMKTMGIPQEFIFMSSMLFKDTQVIVKINGSQSPSFSIKRGVR